MDIYIQLDFLEKIHMALLRWQGPSYGLDSLRRLEGFGQFPAAALAVGFPKLSETLGF